MNDLIKLANQYSGALNELKNNYKGTYGKSIRVCKHRKTYQYYIVDSRFKKPKYINKHDKSVAFLIRNEYNENLIAALTEKIDILRKSVHDLNNCNLTSVYTNLTDGRKPFISSEFLPIPVLAEQWQAENFTKKEIDNVDFMQKTNRGEFVRSKSEAMIANALYDKKIPYKYERQTSVGDSTYYPDFTVMNPRNCKEYIWEHFGLIDDSSYRDNCVRKLRNYSAEGFIPGDNLIMTFETQRVALTIMDVEEKILRYLT